MWPLVPECVKREAEMKRFCVSETGYHSYGVDLDKGAVIVVRPDGIVGSALALDPQVIDSRLRKFLGGILVVE